MTTSHKNRKSNLKSLLEYLLVLKEKSKTPAKPKLAAPEAKPDDPFGQYLFGQERADADREPNTAEEHKVRKNLSQHYGGDMRALTARFMKLKALVDQGKYTKLLGAPPNTLVYRFISNLNPETAAGILNLPVEEITSVPNEAFYVSNIGASPVRKDVPVTSWTIDPTGAVFEDFLDDGGGGSMKVNILLVANTDGNNFLLNPQNIEKAAPKILSYKEEKEVIGYGPINVLEASYIALQNVSPEDKKRKAEQQRAAIEFGHVVAYAVSTFERTNDDFLRKSGETNVISNQAILDAYNTLVKAYTKYVAPLIQGGSKITPIEKNYYFKNISGIAAKAKMNPRGGLSRAGAPGKFLDYFNRIYHDYINELNKDVGKTVQLRSNQIHDMLLSTLNLKKAKKTRRR